MKKIIFVSLLAPLLVACSFASLSNSDRDYTQAHPAPKAFDPNRTQYTCATWTPPSPPDAESHLWYRAAPLLDATKAARKYHKLMKDQPEKIHASLKALAGWYSDKLTPKA